MTPAILSSDSSNAKPMKAKASFIRSASINSAMVASSRLIGALFLAGFLSYGVGFTLVTSVTGSTNFLSTISAVDVGKGVLFYPILENRGKRTALGYLAAMIVEVVLLSVGVLAF